MLEFYLYLFKAILIHVHVLNELFIYFHLVTILYKDMQLSFGIMVIL
jgi:hypothetical protein